MASLLLETVRFGRATVRTAICVVCCACASTAIGLFGEIPVCADDETSSDTVVYGADLGVSVDKFENVYVVGDQIPVTYTVTNVESTRIYLDLGYSGTLLGLTISVVDDRQQEIKPRPAWFGAGPGMGADFSQLYTLKPKEAVQLGLDLAELFPLEKPGRYSVEVLYRGRRIDKRDITLRALDRKKTINVKEYCVHSTTSPCYWGGASAVSCSIECGKVLQDEKVQMSVITVKNTTRADIINAGIRLKAPRDVTLGSVALDYKRQLWTVLESSGETALVVWDIRNRRKRFAIPWGDKPIELGSTRAIYISRGPKVVIAGTPGTTKLSTTSFSWPE